MRIFPNSAKLHRPWPACVLAQHQHGAARQRRQRGASRASPTPSPAHRSPSPAVQLHRLSSRQIPLHPTACAAHRVQREPCPSVSPSLGEARLSASLRTLSSVSSGFLSSLAMGAIPCVEIPRGCPSRSQVPKMQTAQWSTHAGTPSISKCRPLFNSTTSLPLAGVNTTLGEVLNCCSVIICAAAASYTLPIAHASSPRTCGRIMRTNVAAGVLVAVNYRHRWDAQAGSEGR